MITAKSTLAIRRGTSGPWITLEQPASGSGSWSFNDTARSRQVPGLASVLVVQALTTRDGGVQLTLDDNTITHDLMFLRSGFEFSVRIRKEGDGDGKPEVIVVGVATINLNNVQAGARSFQFRLVATSVSRSAQ